MMEDLLRKKLNIYNKVTHLIIKYSTLLKEEKLQDEVEKIMLIHHLIKHVFMSSL